MGWDIGYKTDGGLISELTYNSFANLPSSSIHIEDGGTGGYIQAYVRGEDYFSSESLTACPAQVTNETGWHNLAFFKLYNKSDGSFDNKYLTFRIYTQNARVSDGQWMGNGGWFLYDANTDIYTGISWTGSNVFGEWGSSGYNEITKIFFHTDTVTVGSESYLRIYMGVHCKVEYDPFLCNTYGRIVSLNNNALTNYTADVTEEKSSPEFGPAAEPGGGYIPGGGGVPGGGQPKIPTFDNTSDKITVSNKPTLSAIKSKFLHAYVVTEQSLEYIGDALFPQPVFSQPDLITAMGELGQIIFFNKQVDYMLDLLILPINVPHGDWEPLNVGGRQLSTVIEGTTKFINGQPATDCYVDVTCGGISIDEYWVNFLDFAGTKVKLFLPYVGYVDIQPEYVIGGRLYVDYRFNILDGSFMAYVRSDSGYSELEESLICQYAGVAAVHIPLQSKDYSAKISGLISAIGTVGAGAISGGIGAAAAAGATANAANTIVQKPGTAHANGYNASSSFLSHRTPYLIIERQWSQFSEKYPEEVGLPSNTMCRLGDLHGLVKSANAHLDVIPASVDGKEKISQLLADGIIL